MAKKSFKSLPQRAKKAAFASMSSAGKLKAKSKSGKRTGGTGVAGGIKKSIASGSISVLEGRRGSKLISGRMGGILSSAEMAVLSRFNQIHGAPKKISAGFKARNK